MSKPFRAGMFGGKFMPYHKGHLYCLETASRLCDRVYQLLMANCVDEERILRSLSGDELLALSPERRYARMRAAGRRRTWCARSSGCATRRSSRRTDG